MVVVGKVEIILEAGNFPIIPHIMNIGNVSKQKDGSQTCILAHVCASLT